MTDTTGDAFATTNSTDDVAALEAPVQIHHDELDRDDIVSFGAARALQASGWTIIGPPAPVEPAVPLDVHPDEKVWIHHAELDRYQYLPSGAARALTKTGWVVSDPPPPADDDVAGEPADSPVAATDGTLADQTVPTVAHIDAGAAGTDHDDAWPGPDVAADPEV